MKVIFAAVLLGLVAVYASNDQHISCFHCPYGFLPGEKCLTEDDDFGHAQTCRFGFDNACESLIIDDRNASIYYNRKCARKPISVRFGCHDEDIEIQGEGTYKGRICYCDPAKDGDLCNTELQIPINGTQSF